MNRRKKIKIVLFFILIGLVLGGAGFLAYNYFFPSGFFPFLPSKSSKITSVNPLDGLPADKKLADRTPLAIVVENHPDARPQVGLIDASVVYEAITEGGITRYLAVYGPRDSAKVGPVRSIRTFFLDWAAEYGAFLGHVGGNIDALDRIPVEHAPDLDQFSLGTKAYWREPKAGKAIEHTMFTSTLGLYNAAKDKGYKMTADFRAFKFLNADRFKFDPNMVQSVTIDFSSPSYKVTYTYDSANKKYLRSLGGSPHKDAESGKQLTPTNIIIQEVTRHQGLTRINEDSWTMNTIGEGDAIILYGGQRIDASWKKKDLYSRTLFYDTNNQEISFLPGQFWYEIVPPEVFSKITIKNSLGAKTAAPQISPF